MTTVKLFKQNGKEITVNDIDDAVEVMINDGWRLDKGDFDKKAVKNASADNTQPELSEDAAQKRRTSRRRKVTKDAEA